MARNIRLRSLLLAAIVLGGLVFSACRLPGRLRGTPWIGGVLISFLPNAAPSGFLSAGVYVLDDYDGSPLTTATVSVNGTPLAYNDAKQYYEGNPVVHPGESVTLDVTVGGKEYGAAGQQFDSYPTISQPEPGQRWAYSIDHTVMLSMESPSIADTWHEFGVLDALDPNGSLLWPANGLMEVDPDNTSCWIPANSLGADECYLIFGVEKAVGVPGASQGSGLIIGGYECVPVTVVSGPGIVSMSVNPEGAVRPVGATLQYTAVGLRGDMTYEDVTATAHWKSSDPGVAAVSNETAGRGLATTAGSGTAEITATIGDISASQVLTVSPWKMQKSVDTDFLLDVVWSGTQFAAVGQGEVFTSANGTSWTRHEVSGSGVFYNIAWSGNQFAAVGFQGVWTSPDGVTWTQACSTDGHDIVWSGSQFVVVGSEILTSPDGKDWTVRYAPPSLQLLGVAWSGSRFAAVGYSKKILISPDGITWTQQDSGASDYLTHIASSGTRFVATGAHDLVISSDADGSDWTDLPTVPGAGHVIWTGSRFAGVNENYYAESSDGETWSSAPITTAGPDLDSIAWDGTRFVAVGSSGTVLTSVSEKISGPAKRITNAGPVEARSGAVDSQLNLLRSSKR